MEGSILIAAKADVKKYISAGGFESDIKITSPDGNDVLDLQGWASKHHLNFDTDGTVINAKNAHICLSEQTLVDNAYPVRINDEIVLRNHRIEVKDSSGIVKKYIVKENFPDETLGLIVCILGDFE